MLCVEYDPQLVEKAVFLAARRVARVEGDLHAVIDSHYDIADEELREHAFREAFAARFAGFGLDRTVTDVLDERPLIGRHVGRCLVREAMREKDQSAELFVRRDAAAVGPAQRSIVIQLCPRSLVEPEPVLGLLRRELLHVADMLDAHFAYLPSAIDGLPATQNLVRDRYRVLWDVFVEGRLIREGKISDAGLTKLWNACVRAFTHRGTAPRRSGFDTLLTASALTHHELLAWARKPDLLFGRPERPEPGSTHSPGPGEPCPFCGFPTFDWYPFANRNTEAATPALRQAKPSWNPRDGVCRQCAETYESARP